jgi:hypothetical protein
VPSRHGKPAGVECCARRPAEIPAADVRHAPVEPDEPGETPGLEIDPSRCDAYSDGFIDGVAAMPLDAFGGVSDPQTIEARDLFGQRAGIALSERRHRDACKNGNNDDKGRSFHHPSGR